MTPLRPTFTALLAVSVLSAPLAPAAHASAPVACPGGKGDVAALGDALRAGGTVALAKGCAFTLGKPAGARSALPRVTRDTTVRGNGATLTWLGTQPLAEVAPGARLVLRDVTIRTRQGVSGDAEPVRVVVGRGSTFTMRGGALKAAPPAAPTAAALPGAPMPGLLPATAPQASQERDQCGGSTVASRPGASSGVTLRGRAIGVGCTVEARPGVISIIGAQR